jgi:ATP-dependent DNA helicase RecG
MPFLSDVGYGSPPIARCLSRKSSRRCAFSIPAQWRQMVAIEKIQFKLRQCPILGQLANLGREAVEPPIQIDHDCEDYEGVRLLFIHIPEAIGKPVHIRKRGVEDSFIRSAGTTRSASRIEIATMMMTNRTPSWEELNASPLMEDALLPAQLDLDPIFKMLNRPKMDTRESLLKWMADEKFIQRVPAGGGYITNLGAIAASKPISAFPSVLRKAVRVIQYKGTNKAITIEETIGTMGYAVGFQGLLNYVMRKLPTSEVIESALRTKKPVYPEIALRELIANALIHQDFSITGTGPTVDIFSDRIEFTNPGKLLPSKQTDRLIGTHGESRNEKLARAFRQYGICEERGSGLFKAASECELYGLPPLDFENGENYFKVVLFSPRSFAQMTAKERLATCYQHAQLKFLSSDTMTNKSLRERLMMPEKQRSMVSVLIQEAIARGLIKADPDNTSLKYTEYVPYWV